MSWTKRTLIQEAFGEIGLGVNTFNLDDHLDSALLRLDAMMATWNGKGIRLGYALPSNAEGGNLDDDSGLPDAAYETVICSLAIKIAPGFGKTVSNETKTTAKAGYDALTARAAMPPAAPYPAGMLTGAGAKPWRYLGGNFTPAPADPLLAGGDGPIEFS